MSGCRGGAGWWASVGAFSASRPAYMTMTLSAIWYTSDRSWVMKMVLFDVAAVAEVDQRLGHRLLGGHVQGQTSSAISSEGFSRVESTITMRCRIPPESSIG